jgi:hypothetical protein
MPVSPSFGADVFISYARRDRDFAGRLADALKERGHQVWIDWEDIPPASDWHAEIERVWSRRPQSSLFSRPTSSIRR